MTKATIEKIKQHQAINLYLEYIQDNANSMNFIRDFRKRKLLQTLPLSMRFYQWLPHEEITADDIRLKMVQKDSK